MTFQMLDFIEQKKLGGEHDPIEIEQFIKSLVKNEIPDYQVAAWLMAVRINGMTDEETSSLTQAMAESGEMIDLSAFPEAADKHSTGGVGDKTTLIIAPLVASCGVPVIKFSGRALDFTGGTLDKLESIPGFKTSLTVKQVLDQAQKIGVALTGASESFVPADKILYAMRDVTSTVDSIPLIAASVMSKKIAGGANSIVLDVKHGDGAFMKRYVDSKLLAETMVTIGTNLGRKMSAVLSSMDQPLGMNVGNSLEVIEVIETLKGNGPGDLVDLCLELSSRMISLSRSEPDLGKIKTELRSKIEDGSALGKFREMIKTQGGDDRVIDNYGLFPTAQFRYSMNASKSVYIERIATKMVGNLVRRIGGGRFTKTDVIDLSVGMRFFKKSGDKVDAGDKIVDVYYNNPAHKELIEIELSDAIELD